MGMQRSGVNIGGWNLPLGSDELYSLASGSCNLLPDSISVYVSEYASIQLIAYLLYLARCQATSRTPVHVGRSKYDMRDRPPTQGDGVFGTIRSQELLELVI